MIETLVRKFNDKQTELSEKKLEKLNKYTRDNLLDAIDSIELLSNLVASDRRTVKEMPKDKNGKVIVDFEDPHILEDTDYFRPLAIQYEKTGKFTDIFPNPAKTSEYVKFWETQIERCKYGYAREDGEWITGYHYFYLNLSPILKTVIPEGAERTKDGKIVADRVVGFPDFWDGDYLYYHYLEKAKQLGKHGNVLKTRGRGYSFKNSSILSCNYFVWDKSDSYALAADETYLTGGDGLLVKAWDIIDFVNEHTPLTRSALPDKSMHRKAAYKDAEGNTRGAKSSILGMTLKNDPEKHRGKRGKTMFFEESGKFPHLIRAWDIARKSFEQGGRVFGQMCAFGTGGSKGNNFDGAKQFLYTPTGYNIMPLRNVYDKNAGSGYSSFWMGEYFNREDCMDEDGNSDVIKALIEVFEGRREAVESGVPSQTILQRKAEEAITPQEAILRTETTDFPVAELKEHLGDIQANYQSFISPHYVGIMTLKGGNIEFEQSHNLVPIRKFPINPQEDRTGAIEIFSPPKEGTRTLSIGDRYIIGVDPVRYDDVEHSVSLASAFVFDLWLDEIAAEYSCRPVKIDDFHEQVRRLAIWYNAEVNFENDVTSLYTYFKNKGSLMYLSDTPSIVKAMELGKERSGNRAKGTPSGVKLNAQARQWASQFLLEKVKNANEDDESEKNLLNLHKIRSIALLEELSSWNPDGNFDRVSAFGMVMVSRMDKLFTLDYRMGQAEEEEDDDDFFKENYDNIFGDDNDPSSDNFDISTVSLRKQELINKLIDYEHN